MNRPIGIVMALKREAAGLWKRLDGRKRGTHQGFSFLTGSVEGRKVVLVASGMGRTRSEHATIALVEGFTPSTLLSAGLAGALQPDLQPGEIILGERILDQTPSVPYADPLLSSPALIKLARETAKTIGLPHRQGTLLTSPRILIEPTEKQEAARSGALAADLESAAVARVASCARLPFLAIRGVSDTLDQPLGLDFNRLTGRKGEVSATKVLLKLLVCPKVVPSLWRLKQTSGSALGVLTAFLLHFLPLLPIGEDAPIRG
ncbi:MAG: hypothetical protein HY347_03755 [candidate division NC10 bacterium]|nr:hypothetical protein [candidate division NC10 bacterium]